MSNHDPYEHIPGKHEFKHKPANWMKEETHTFIPGSGWYDTTKNKLNPFDNAFIFGKLGVFILAFTISLLISLPLYYIFGPDHLLYIIPTTLLMLATIGITVGS